MEHDPYHGQGGSYIVKDGKRELVSRTKEPQSEPEASAPALAEEIPAAPARKQKKD